MSWLARGTQRLERSSAEEGGGLAGGGGRPRALSPSRPRPRPRACVRVRVRVRAILGGALLDSASFAGFFLVVSSDPASSCGPDSRLDVDGVDGESGQPRKDVGECGGDRHGCSRYFESERLWRRRGHQNAGGNHNGAALRV